MSEIRRPWEPESEQETNDFLEAALEAAARGWAVFPLAPNGKVPLLKRNWQKIATTDPSEIRAIWNEHPSANIGIATGQVSGVSVVDVDIKGGRAGEESAQKLGLPFFDTHTVRTASGGWHYYFLHPEGFRNRAGILEGIDTRGDGGYVVAEGSIIDDEPYELANVGDVQQMPESVLRLCAPRETIKGEDKPDGPAIQVNDDEIKRIRAALGFIDADPYDTWRDVGMALYELGGGSDQMFELWDHWSASSPKYDGAIMRKRWSTFASDRPDKITESTFWYMAREAGYTDPAGDLIFVPPSSNELDFSVGELDAWQSPSMDEVEIWQGSVISRGNMTLIAGPPKIGKSLFVQHLLMSAAAGTEFLGHPFERAYSVLWLQAEIRKLYLRETRIRPAMQSGAYSAQDKKRIAKNFRMTDRLDLEITTKREFDILAALIAKRRPDIIVIDPVINFSSAEENDAGQTKNLLRAARQLARAGDTDPHKEPALVLVHHTRKVDPKYGPGPDPFSNIRGSGAFRGYYDSGMMLLPDKSGSLALHYETRNQVSPKVEGLEFDGEAAAWKPAHLAIEEKDDGTFSALEATSKTAAIATYLRTLPEPFYVASKDLKTWLRNEYSVGERTAETYLYNAIKESPALITAAGSGPKRILYSPENAYYVEPKLAKTLDIERGGNND